MKPNINKFLINVTQENRSWLLTAGRFVYSRMNLYEIPVGRTGDSTGFSSS
jgi:hypothetical protein